MRFRDQPAEVRIPLGSLGEQRHVRAVQESELRTGDCLHAELLRFLGECHRAVEAVVIGEPEGRVAELRGGERELLGERSAVEEREGGVAVELGVHKVRSVEYGVLN